MLDKIRNKVLSGKRLTEADALKLFQSNDLFPLASLASYVAEEKNGKKAYFVRNRHINPTNICVNRCRFCAFSRSIGQDGAYELTIAEIIKKLKQGRAKSKIPFSEVHIVGGLHPEWPFTYYLELVSTIKKNFPKLHIKAFTAVEIDYFSKISGLSLEETLTSLKRRGLGSMPGGGAEIFAPGIRNRLCPEKISGERWLAVMAAAHKVGLRTNATMLYGHIESYEDRVDHMMKLRRLQDRTGGFQAFIPLAYHPKNTDIQGSYTSGIDDLKTIAISRLYLDNFQHIKAYWVMLGEKISQLALKFGADDIDGTIIEEKITHSAGALTGEQLTAEQLSDLIIKAGRIPVERDSFYRKVRRAQ
ncbi:MAG: aminofutalosine synthase MqnE [Nitrospirota bacterium]|nr:aminofutalosine synthase MqnE [Nitrospirota bacterium]